MSRQIQIYAVNDDLSLLQGVIEKIEPVVYLRSQWSSAAPEMVADLQIHERGKEPWVVYLCRVPDLVNVCAKRVKGRGHWSVDQWSSPVIELDRSYHDGKTCSRGRLYYMTGYYNGDTWTPRSIEFVRWADAVLRSTRRTFRRDKELGAYLGPAVLKLRQEGLVELPLNW